MLSKENIGQPVPAGEALRIMGLSDDERKAEIDQLVQEVSPEEEGAARRLSAELDEFFENPDAFARVPDGRIPSNPNPLPYVDPEGDRRR